MQGRLIFSSNRGRYVVCDSSTDLPGTELTAGMAIEVDLYGQWIPGRVEHGPVYATERTQSGKLGGYYFIAHDGSVCGLCEGMEVRIHDRQS